ncbi:MAG: ATP-binding protein [Azonexus sp.]|nr:ATP-binding protein [Azonexus sp.]
MNQRLTRLKLIYAVALSVVASCMLAASWTMQHAISSNSDEARIINLSGRQRMLSQRLTKATLALPHEPTQESRQARIREIGDSLKSWMQVDEGLRHGDPTLSLPQRKHSGEITRLFAEISPHFQAMTAALVPILSDLEAGHFDAAKIAKTGELLLAREAMFLHGMDAITYQFDAEARAQLASMRKLELTFLCIGLVILLIEFILVFRPSLASIQALLSEIERKRTEMQIVNSTLEGMLEQSQELAHKANVANEAKSVFLANMSHELRTPIHGVLGMNELLLMTRVDDEQKEYLASISSSAHELLRLIDDILDFSKYGSGKFQLESVDFDFGATLKQVIDTLSPQAAAKSLSLISHVDTAIPAWLRGDPLRLRQVLLVLAENAIKFTATGEVSIRVDISALSKESVGLRFGVSDTGIGIPADMIGRLFDPFIQADVSMTRRYGGIGLGLSIAQSLVEMMGGKLGVASKEGKGSTFGFEVTFLLSKTPNIP